MSYNQICPLPLLHLAAVVEILPTTGQMLPKQTGR